MYLQFQIWFSHIRLLFAAMSQALDSVLPETITRDTPASGASTSLRASSVVNVAEHDIVEYDNDKFSADKAYAMAKEAVEKGEGNWGRTDITLLNPCLK